MTQETLVARIETLIVAATAIGAVGAAQQVGAVATAKQAATAETGSGTDGTAAAAASVMTPATAVAIAPQMAQYLNELQRWNRAIRLVGQSDDEALLAHLTDSLSAYPLLTALIGKEAGQRAGGGGATGNDNADTHNATTGGASADADGVTTGGADASADADADGVARATIGDVGSGNGMPGIPLALCMPQCNFQLIESNQKRCAFLRNVIALLRLENCTVISVRVEELARQRQERTAWRALLVRALTNWNTKLASALANCLDADGKAIIYAIAESEKSAVIATTLQSAFSVVKNITLPSASSPHRPLPTRMFLVASFGTSTTKSKQ